MSGQGRGYRDFLSQSSSSVPSTFSGSAAADAAAGDYSFFPEAPADPGLSAPRSRLENLDLNSQEDTFPYLQSYSGILQSEGWRGEPSQPTLGHGGRTGHGAFQPPRHARGGGTAAGGNRRSRSAGSGSVPHAAVQGTAGRGRAPLIRNPAVRGGMAAIPQAPGVSDGIEEEEVNIPNPEENEEEQQLGQYMRRCRKRRKEAAVIGAMIGMLYYNTYLNKADYRVPVESGYDWVMRTLENPRLCYNMFRMSRNVFDRLHHVLVESYGLKSTNKMKSVEAVGLFLWMCGAPQGMRQAEDKFTRSTETCSRKFDQVLQSVHRLAADIITPKDPEFRTVHKRLQAPRFSPFFDNCIGAIDGTHIEVVVPTNQVLQHTGRHKYTSQNVLAICDFDMRFTFVVAGWPGSVHDMRVFNEAHEKYAHKFPHPPQGKFYLVDSVYSNQIGYLSPYRCTKYHLPEFRQGPMPRGKKELFNYTHSSLRNVIERSFGVLKNKWRILHNEIPSYPMRKQSKIIMACMALHNFIRESSLADEEFDRCDLDVNYVPLQEPSSSYRRNRVGAHEVEDDHNMNQFRDSIADGLFSRL